jgi:hypothetical protein
VVCATISPVHGVVSKGSAAMAKPEGMGSKRGAPKKKTAKKR